MIRCWLAWVLAFIRGVLAYASDSGLFSIFKGIDVKEEGGPQITPPQCMDSTSHSLLHLISQGQALPWEDSLAGDDKRLASESQKIWDGHC